MKNIKSKILFLFGLTAIILLICLHRDIYLFFKFNKMYSALESAEGCKVVSAEEDRSEANVNMARFVIRIEEPSLKNCLKAIGAANNVLSDPDNILNKKEYLVLLRFQLKGYEYDYNYATYLEASNVMEFNNVSGSLDIDTAYRCGSFCSVFFNAFHEPISKFSDITVFENNPNIKNIVIGSTDGLTYADFFNGVYDDAFTEHLDKYDVIFFPDKFYEKDYRKMENIKRQTNKCKIFSFNNYGDEGYKEYMQLFEIPSINLDNAQVKSYSK